MGRYFAWALGAGFGIVLSAAPAAAQVDIGVWTPNVGGHVVIGSPRVYVPQPVYVPEPVYVYEPRVYVVERDYYYRPYRGRPIRGWEKKHYKRHGGYVRGYDYRPHRVYRADPYRRVYRDDRYYRDHGRRRR